MATPSLLKRRSMNAITHSETQTHMRAFRGASSQKAPVTALNPTAAASLGRPNNMKRFAMSAISGVETVAQVGTMRLLGGIAVYSGRIMEMDREAQRDAALRNFNKAQEKKSHELGRE